MKKIKICSQLLLLLKNLKKWDWLLAVTKNGITKKYLERHFNF